MRILKIILTLVYVILIILLLLTHCNRCHRKTSSPKPFVEDSVIVRPTPLPIDTTSVDTTQAVKDEIVDTAAVRHAEQVGHSGNIKITLLWDFKADIDLHVIDPSGCEIYFGNKKSPTGGEHDVDNKEGVSSNGKMAEENVFWKGTPPPGQYQVSVKYFGASEKTKLMESGECRVVVFVEGQAPQTYRFNMSQKGEEIHVCDIDMN